MSDFLESLTDGLPETAANLELPETETADLLQTALSEAGEAAELSAGDVSWLENLLHRIVSPLIDIFDHSEGEDNQKTVSPLLVNENVTSEAIERYNIFDATDEWHIQDGDNSCAVCAQQFIINEFTNLDVSENTLCVIGEENGWFNPEGGTSPRNVGKLLELFGINTQTNFEGSISDIKATLDQGGRVIVGVDSLVLWNRDFGLYPIYGADHAIEVIGIDDSNPADVQVIINDSGAENGCGRSIPYQQFMNAWTPSGGFMVSAFPKD